MFNFSSANAKIHVVGAAEKKRGCPCRDEVLRCADQCSCGTKKAACKNKETTATTKTSSAESGLTAFQRHNIAVEESKTKMTVRNSL